MAFILPWATQTVYSCTVNKYFYCVGLCNIKCNMLELLPLSFYKKKPNNELVLKNVYCGSVCKHV